MSERYGLVSAVHAVGVRIGPSPDSACENCSHLWGGHQLYPVTENALDGGTWACPEDCTCFGTWDVPMPSALRAAYDEKVARRFLDL